MLENDDSPEAKGKRLQILRVMAGLSRMELAEKANVGKTSITYWEHAKTAPMKPRSMNKILEAIRNVGVECHEEWLLTGKGTQPCLKSHTANIASTRISNKSKPLLDDEIELFKIKNKLSVIYKVENNSMYPVFRKSDIVGGIWTSALNLKCNDICIVEHDSMLDIRCVKLTNKKEVFNLSYLTYEPDQHKPFEVISVKLMRVAQIIRLWREIN